MSAAKSSVRWYGSRVSREVREQMKRRLLKAGQLTIRTVRRNISVQGPPRSKPGEFPHRETGELARSLELRFDRRSLTIQVLASASYAPFIETRRSFLRRTLRELRPQLREILIGSSGATGRYKLVETP